MNLDIRLDESHIESKLWDIWATVYRRDDPIPIEDRRIRPGELNYIAYNQSEPVACYGIWPMDCARREGTMRCAGVLGVAVLPEHRHQGVGRQMMLHSLQELRQQDFVFASLYAFRDSYYRNFGYEVCGQRWRFKVPQHRLPKWDVTLPVRKIAKEDVEVLKQAYEPFIRARSGSAIRRPGDWENRLGKRAPMIYAVGDPIEAYALTTMEGSFWEDLTISEVVWSTPRGYESIMGVLAGLCINRSALIWCEPSDSPYMAMHWDQGATVEIFRQSMYRILDVPGALKSLKTDLTGEFTIEIVDPFIAACNGCWSVRYSPEGIEARRASSADLRCSVGAFSQAFLGQPSWDNLRAIGKIESFSDRADRAAAALLTPTPTVCMDFF